jgi:hypothetical protein
VGTLPKAPTKGEVVQQQLDFQAYDNLVAPEPIYVGVLTGDTNL